jgi:hypothetical protein
MPISVAFRSDQGDGPSQLRYLRTLVIWTLAAKEHPILITSWSVLRSNAARCYELHLSTSHVLLIDTCTLYDYLPSLLPGSNEAQCEAAGPRCGTAPSKVRQPMDQHFPQVTENSASCAYTAQSPLQMKCHRSHHYAGDANALCSRQHLRRSRSLAATDAFSLKYSGLADTTALWDNMPIASGTIDLIIRYFLCQRSLWRVLKMLVSQFTQCNQEVSFQREMRSTHSHRFQLLSRLRLHVPTSGRL